MTVKTGQAWAGTFVTLDATGALATPGTGPAGVLYVDGVANVAAVTITGTNPYKWAVTLPALTAGQRVEMYITATIATIATAAVVAGDQADTSLLSDGVAVASIASEAITAASIKTDAITEIQSGLAVPGDLMGLADDAITASKFDETTAYPVKSADAGATQIARKGADADTLKTLSDQIDGIDLTGVATAVWASSTRTLTQSAASVAAAVAGSTITCQRGDTLSASLTGLGDLSDRVKLWGTVKSDPSLPDTAATLMAEETAGLTRVNGAAYTTITDGDITVTDEVTGALTWTIQPAVTKDLAPGPYTYDLQKLTAAGVVTTVTYAQFIVTGTGDITRAVA